MLSGNIPDEEQRVVADVLAHLALAVERRRRPVNRVGFEQHLADIVERALVGIAKLKHLLDFAELRQHVDDVVLHLGIAQADVTVEVVVDQFAEQRLSECDSGIIALCSSPTFV